MTARHESVVPAGVEETFRWHQRRGALSRLIPPWLPIRVLRDPPPAEGGEAVLALPGGVRWVARHAGYHPPDSFEDDLVSLPFRWRHVHSFQCETDVTTRVVDSIETPIPGALLRQSLRYRHRQLADDLRAHTAAWRDLERPLTVATTGSSGLVGSALSSFLTSGGHRVVRLVRREPASPDERRWRPDEPAPDLLDGIDAVVHLAGASIAGRFTAGHKWEVRASRVGPTRRLAGLIASARHPPQVMVCASAIGFYGPDRGDEELTEESERGEGFLADLVSEWEQAAAGAALGGARVVSVRTGMVQSPRGGTLRLLRPLFELGAGGRMGDGSQWISWIDLDDLLDVYYEALTRQDLTGPVNAVSPQPVRNAEYASVLARVLRRPAVVPTPAIGPRLLLGREGAVELAAASQKVVPRRLESTGHHFRRSGLEECLRHQLGRVREVPRE